MKQQFIDYRRRNFFFSNTYDNPEDAKYRAIKVEKDLMPFCDYITKSIENLKSLKNISAECREVKPRTVLVPRGRIIRVKEVQTLRIKLPEENYYCFKWHNDEYGYFDKFVGLAAGLKTILLKNSHTDIHNDCVVFSYGEQLDTDKKYALYLDGENFPKECSISKLDFSDLTSYSVESGEAEFESAYVDSSSIIYQYSGKPDKTVKLFNRISCNTIFEKSAHLELNKVISSAKEGARIYDESAGIVVLNGADDFSASKGKHSLQFEILSAAEIIKLISEESRAVLSLKNGMIESSSSELGKHKFAVLKNGTLTPLGSDTKEEGIIFEVKTVGQKRNCSKNTVMLELVEDDNSIGDIYSNVSYFFLETVEEVKDERDKTHKIKKKIEHLSQIEIDYKPGSPIPKKISIIPNEHQLKMQLKALESIMYTPNRMHAPILELMQEKSRAEWGEVDYKNANIREWYALTDPGYKGCDSQREFVKKSLATPDFAILEGPPGSGKTTTILEIIAQAIAKGQRVLLAASTNAAIDNILERISILPEQIRDKILAVRLGNESSISKSVDDYTVFDIEDKAIANEIVSRANLVCGTIIGILKHPEFKISERYTVPAVPLYDYLIIDEASKTTFQEFLVPAVYSKKWILSGDLKQLTPYIDKDNIAATLTRISGFDKDAQQAQTILMHLKNEIYDRLRKWDKKPRFVVRANSSIIRHLPYLVNDYKNFSIATLSDKATGETTVSTKDYLEGNIRAALVWGCDVLFCDNEVYKVVKNTLPHNFIPLLFDKKDIVSYKSDAYWLGKSLPRVGNNDQKDTDKFKDAINGIIKKKTWSSEIAWRLVRIQELFMLSEIEKGNDSTIKKYQDAIEERIPEKFKESAKRDIKLLREIALPSIIQLLQQGLSDDIKGSSKITTLNSGFDKEKLNLRHTLVEYQHRMHSDISRFSAENIYEGNALKNGNMKRNWEYDAYTSHAVWLNVENASYNRKERSDNFNFKEIDVIIREVKRFLEFAKKHPRDDQKKWTIACLTYYKRQENLLKDAIKNMLKTGHPSNFYSLEDYKAEIMIYSVDKFQGKEADIVFLSMVKDCDASLGFMDSPNRLNVAITRAKYQMVIVGSLNYFKKQEKSKLLKKLALEYTNDTYTTTKG